MIYKRVTIVALIIAIIVISYKNFNKSRTLNFWISPCTPGDSYYKWLEIKANEFQSETGIKIIINEAVWQNAHDALKKNLLSENENNIDVMQIKSSWLPELAETGKIDEMNLKNFGGKNNFFKANIRTCRYKGKNYSVPWVTNTRALVYNKKMFSSINAFPPMTYLDIENTGKKIIDKYGKGTAIAVPGTTSWDLINDWSVIMWANGGDIFKENKKISFNDEAGINAMKWYIDLIKQGLANEACAQYSQLEVNKSFINGKTAMCYMTPGDILKISKENSDLDFSVVEPPAGKSGKSAFIESYNFSISRNCINKNAAYAWINFLLNDKNIIEFSKQSCNYLPAKIGTFNNSYYLDDTWQVFKKTLDNAYAYPNSKNWQYIENEIMDGIRNTLTDYVNGDYNEETVSKYFDQAAENIDNILYE